ncbi:hypothetical protein ACH5RR_015549 [Cinchona calisaya]|uniref:Uncharacterized protein n=1 Tax=Cinchona calisaya TaxID=153742 RepID=A0ABD2ZWL1_9GENT
MRNGMPSSKKLKEFPLIILAARLKFKERKGRDRKELLAKEELSMANTNNLMVTVSDDHTAAFLVKDSPEEDLYSFLILIKKNVEFGA